MSSCSCTCLATRLGHYLQLKLCTTDTSVRQGDGAALAGREMHGAKGSRAPHARHLGDDSVQQSFSAREAKGVKNDGQEVIL
jgi:hypothetical protein